MYCGEAFVDFPTWLASTQPCLGSTSPVAPPFDAVSSHVADALPYVRNTRGLEVEGAGGIGVLFPGSEGSFEHNVYWDGDHFLATQFASQGWYAFLASYWGGN